MKNVLILSGLAVALLVGCATQSEGSNETTSTSPEPADPTTSTTSGRTSVAPETTDTTTAAYLSDDLTEQVIALASAETDVAPGEFEVEMAAEVTWSDGSLGCPQQGQSYTQALVDGYWIVLTHDGETFDYRSTREGDFRRCLDGAPPVSIYQDR